MEYFLQVFGDYTIGWAAAVICSLLFIYVGCKKIYDKVSEKSIRDNERDKRIQQVIDQAEKYPLWHAQSLEIQDQYNGMFKEISEKLDNIGQELIEIKDEREEDKATTSRYRILRFSDEILHKQKHSKEHFNEVLQDITKYTRYCAEHPNYENDRANFAIENVREQYRECTQNDSFL